MTDELLTLVVLAAGAGVLARIAARYVRIEGPLGWPLGRESRERFWRDTMPWPHGVQEDSEIAWHVPRAASGAAGSPVDDDPPASRGQAVPPTRPQARLTGR